MGHRGQRIFVVPQHDLVAVFTCFDAPRTPDFVMRSHIIPSIVSDAAVPADTAAELGIQSFKLDFGAKRDAATLEYMQNDRLISVDIGLDNVYRLSKAPGQLSAFKGRWRSDYTFYFSFFEVGYTFTSRVEMAFDENRARVRLTNPQGGIVELKATSDPDLKRKVENKNKKVHSIAGT